MKKTMTIKDIFTDDTEKKSIVKKEIKKDKTDEQTQRMLDISNSLGSKSEIYLKENKKVINQDLLNKEISRYKTIARIDEFNNNKMAANGSAAYGNSVNTFLNNSVGKSVNTFLDNPNTSLADRNHNPNYTYLQPAEALRLSISRSLTSGAPIANVTFYDEVNWNLNNLGFDSKTPLDIKQAILKMIKD